MLYEKLKQLHKNKYSFIADHKNYKKHTQVIIFNIIVKTKT